jgi:hypothetical protein
MSYPQDTTLDRWAPLAWTLYKSVVRVSSVTAVCVYLVVGWVIGVGPIGPMLVIGIILAFCLMLGVPAAILGVFVAALLRAVRPVAGRGVWLGVGGATGLAAVMAVFAFAASRASMSHTTGALFWATFLLTAVLAGTRAGATACRYVRGVANTLPTPSV